MVTFKDKSNRILMAYIDAQLMLDGEIGVNQLANDVGLSRAKASRLLNKYLSDHPGNVKRGDDGRIFERRKVGFEPHYLNGVGAKDYLLSFYRVFEVS